MSYTLSPILKLRLDSNLTANARFNLLKLDALGSAYLVDASGEVVLRSAEGITLRPDDASAGGAGSGTGTVTVDGNMRLLDQASGGSKYLTLKYASDANGSADTSASRALSIDVDGADRSLVLGGNLRTTGGNLVVTLTGATAVTLPTSGTLSTLAGSETLTNKTLSAASNTITGLTSANLSASAGITYSQLSLTGGLVNADVNAAAAIDGTKVSPAFGAQRISTSVGLRLTGGVGGAHTLDVVPSSSQAADVTLTLPPDDGTAGQYLSTDGSGGLSWVDAPGSGTVTSVAMTVPGILSVSGSPVTTSGTLALSLATQTANTVFAGPTTGSAATPAFRALVAADIPTLSTSNVTEGSNLYWTTARGQSMFDTRLALKTTDDLAEGVGNQYYTTTRFDTRLATKSTTDIAEGSNLYYTTARFDTRFGTKTTTDLTEGTNLYWTTARGQSMFDTRLATKSTSDLSEGTNLYYTTARFDTRLALKTTSDLAEGANLYWTTARGQAVVDAYSYQTTWTSGTSKTVTHSLGTRNVRVDLYDLTTLEAVWVDTVVMTDSNTVTLTTSVAPSGSGWEILITKV